MEYLLGLKESTVNMSEKVIHFIINKIMEKRIFQYTLETKYEQTIILPKGADILTIQTQFNNPQLWALVDQNETEKEKRYIEIYENGEGICYDRKYLGTYQLDDGNFVFHVFEAT